MAEKKVDFEELNTTTPNKKIGMITLNAPEKINAIDFDMVHALYEQLISWHNNDSIVCVFLQGAGEKGFCAGADVRNIYHDIQKGNCDSALFFFEKEYRLDYLIHTYKKPIICWGNGYVMGGGTGLMAGADFRVVTDRTILAMPEISIGLYPDVGGSWFLNHLPQGIGLFIALTACKLNAGDALYLGIGNRFIDHSFKESLIENLQEAQWSQGDNNYTITYNIIKRHQQNSKGWLPYSKIREYRDLITSCTDQYCLTHILEAIKALPTEDEWLKQAQQVATNDSPLSAYIAYEQMKRTKHASLKEVFMSELILSVNCCLRGDFVEGVRARLIDKDYKPKWQHRSIQDIDADSIARYFETPWGAVKHPLSDL